MPATSLTTRLVLLLTMTIVMTLTAVSLVDYISSRARILSAEEARVESTVASAVNDLEVRLSVLEESTELLAEIIQLGDYSEAQLRQLLHSAVDGREDLFGAAIALTPRFSASPVEGFAAYYYYRDGEIVFNDLAQAYDYLLSVWFRDPASAGKPVWTEPYYDDGGGNAYMATYSVPMYRNIDGESVFYGVVTADITLQELQYYLDRMQLGQRGFGFMLSRSGKIMASPEPGNLLKPWAQTLPNPEHSEIWGRLITRVASGETASADVPCRDQDDRCVVKLAPLQTTLWPVGAYYSEHEILAPLRDYLTKSLLSGLVTLLLLLVGVIWVSRRITQPLRSLAIATVDIATGNFHTKLPQARSRDELGRLVHAFYIMQQNLQRFVSELEQETASRNRLEGELNAATAIQMSMLPSAGKANITEDAFYLWAALQPAKSVGGDLYTYHLCSDNRLFLAVGDVSDKGVPAALFMARAMTLLQQYVNTDLDPGAILFELNNELVEGNENCMFLTLFMGWLDLGSLQLSFASGGHTPPSLLNQAGADSLAQETGPALGLMEDVEFPLNQLQLLPGELLAVFTDGIDEAFNAEEEQFGFDAFNRILSDTAGQSLAAVGQTILAAVHEHQGEVPQSDDITLLLLQPREPGSQRNSISLEDDAGAISTLLAWMGQLLDEAEVNTTVQGEAKLVAEEVVTNVFKYGQLARGSAVLVQIQLEDGQLVMEFRDHGVAFDPLAEAQRAQLGEDTESAAVGGLGVHLLEALTDAQSYQRSGDLNFLRLVKHLRG
ncbi:MAG: SpoIIE family protein phosphatase [Halieaceae bacterium]